MESSRILVSRTIEAFKKLQGCENNSKLTEVRCNSFLAADLLRALYEVGLQKPEFTKEERKLITERIRSALFAIGNWISFTTERFPPHNNLADSKRERSGLQFLLGHHEDFIFEDYNTVREILDDFEQAEDIGEWDELFEEEASRVRFDVTDFDLSEEEKLRIPQDHWWCFDA